MKDIRNLVLTLLNTISKLISIVIVNKIILEYYGQKEFLIYGDIVSYLNMFVVIGTLGLPNSLVVYTRGQKGLVPSVLFLSSIYSIGVLSVLVLLLGVTFDLFTCNFLSSVPKRELFVICGIILVLFNFKLSGLVGLGKVSQYHFLQIGQNILMVILIIVGVKLNSFALVVYALGFAAAIFVIPQINIGYRLFKKGLLFKNIFSSTDFKFFMIVGVLSSLVNPALQVLGRHLILDSHELSAASGYHAALKVSEGYMLFVNLVLFTLLLPKLAEVGRSKASDYVVFVGGIGLFFVLLFGFLFLCGAELYQLIFDSELLEYSNLPLYVVVADFFRTISLSIALLFYARQRLVLYATLEFLSATTLFFAMIFIGNTDILMFYKIWIIANMMNALVYSVFFFIYDRK